MAPNLGRGACESLVDAAVLGRALTSMPLEDALRHYEHRRLVPPQVIRWASGRALSLAMPGRFPRARNAIVRALPGRTTGR